MTFVAETRTVFVRSLRLSVRNPAWVIIGLLQPVLYIVFFGPLLKPLAGQLGASNAYQLFVPGIMVQLGFFGALFVGFGLIAELRAGVVESQRVTPASRGALLLGRVLRDVLVLVVQAVVLVLVSIPFGLRAPVAGVVLAIAVVGLLGAACASASYAVALTTKSEDVLAPLLNTVAFPIILLSGILLPMSLGPGWLRDVASVNPFKHVVDGVRAAFRGDLGSTDAIAGAVITVVLAGLGLFYGARTFRRESS